ncbi:ATPase [Bacteroidia bacterium]|nr:ATPase [Bacteroidia bacterium]
MKFYNREKEIATLQQIEKKSKNVAQMTIVVGRRRIGKTELLKRAFTASPVLYFFVEKKTEFLLCEEFLQEIRLRLQEEIYGEIKTFKALFAYLIALSARRNFTLIIDEFQEFQKINPSIFSEIQNVWDANKEKSRMNLVLCGSIYSMMKRIFESSKEPLFGRATAKIHLKPFTISTLKAILAENAPKSTNEDLLVFYMITGGIAKYVEQLVDNKAFTKEKIFAYLFSDGSFFLNEGKDVLIDEFGKDYGTYFSILSLIASSKTGRGDIESTLGFDVGGYLDKLENEYNIINRRRPFGAKEGSRNNQYLIEDNFLNFWFRFIYKYRSAVEIGNLDYVRNVVERDYETYSGLVLEKYFRTQLIETKQFSAIGSYWDRRGENEIDIIAENEMEKRLVFYEVKRNEKRINLSVLENKASEIVKKYPHFEIEYKKLSLDRM